DQTACAGGTNPTLTVSVGAGETADWYDSAIGGTLLTQGTTSFVPSQNAPGVYVFYAETRLIAGNCISPTRTPVSLILNAPPVAVASLASGGVGSDVCEGQSLQLDASASTGASPLSFAWNNAASLDDANLANPTATPSVTTIYTVTVTDGNGCTATAGATIFVNANPSLALGSPACDPTFTNYSFSVNLTGGDQLTVSVPGSVSGSGTSYTVTAPIDQDLILTATNSATGCFSMQNVNGLDCNCATTLPPVSSGDLSVCEGAATPTLSVTVAANETADWYDVATGGTALAIGTTSYSPFGGTAGVYVFYVETRNTGNGCLSNSRTPITLTINVLPTANAGVDASFCEGGTAILNGSGTGVGTLV
ncbi:MAG: hypothetical protein AAB401_10740, partial [Acidobacteriota bacterium]